MKDGIRETLGKRIVGVVSASNRREPKNQLFLLFDDGTFFEIWGESFSGSGGVAPGGLPEIFQMLEMSGARITQRFPAVRDETTGRGRVERFDSDEDSYLAWVAAHPHGFVANVDRAGAIPDYPMVHAATHALISSPRIGNFTTGDYIKLCSADLAALEQYVKTEYGRHPTRCSQCMKTAAPSPG